MRAVTEQPTGHSVHDVATKVASPGMTPSSGGTRYGISFSDLRDRSQPASTDAPEATPIQRKNSRLSIVFLSSLACRDYLWQIVQSVGAPFSV